MFKLNEPLNDTIELSDGRELELDLAFDNVLDMFDVMAEEDDQAIMFAQLVYLLVGEEAGDDLPPELAIELITRSFDEYINTENKSEYVETDLLGNELKRKKPAGGDEQKSMSLLWDAEAIWSGFKSAYDMDLHDEFGKLHWRKFMALFQELPSDTKIKQMMEIRTWKPDKHTTPEERQRMAKLQAEFKLPDDD
jgi:hypothetical protein